MDMTEVKSVYAVLEEIRPLRILLIEENMASQFAIARCLENLGNDLDICSCPGKALSRVADQRYDLIIVDLNLAMNDGLELAKCLKQACEMSGSDPKIIGMTNLDHPLLDVLFSYCQIDDYVIRSTDYHDLKKKIVNLCYLNQN
jgi:DNA-binding response OmpR family regulator